MLVFTAGGDGDFLDQVDFSSCLASPGFLRCSFIKNARVPVVDVCSY